MNVDMLSRLQPRTRLARSTVATLLLVALPRLADAQLVRTATVVDCDDQFLKAAAPDTLSAAWLPRYPAIRIATWRPLMEEGRWLELIDSVRTSFSVEAARYLTDTLSADPRVERFRTRLDSLRDRMKKLEAVGSVQALISDAELLRRIGPSAFRPTLRDGEAILFRLSAEEIRLTNNDRTDFRRTICYHSVLASFLTDRFTADARNYATEVLAKKEERWAAYFDRGYSQLPWELFVNSRAARNAGILDPPARQLILFHPSVSIQVAGDNWRQLESNEAVAVEPIGFIWYRNDYRSYFGVSSIVVFANGTGTSVGPFLHFGRVAKIGYTFPLKQKRESSASLPSGAVISVDLYKYLSNRSAQVGKVMDGITKQALSGSAPASR